MRFTNKNGTICYWWDKRNDQEEIHKQELANQKLCALEDIEEELGIDLLTLFKALKEGIYVKVGKQIKRTHWCISLNANGMYGERETSYWFAYRVNGFDFPDTYERLKLGDYGKTWALTKEELNH